MVELDVILDILKRITERVELPDGVVKQVERDARQYWGGERCYVAKAGESPRRREAFIRAEQVRADHRRGESVQLLARRYELTERHIRRLLGIVESLWDVPANDDSKHRPLPVRKSRVRRKSDITLP